MINVRPHLHCCETYGIIVALMIAMRLYAIRESLYD